MAGDARRLARILASQVPDERVVAALTAVPRERFVPAELRRRAHENGALPIGWDQTISQPVVVARMTQALELDGTDRVLDVGTGSGYHAAVLAQLAASVVTVERIPALAARAVRALHDLQVASVTCLVGDATRLRRRDGQFDAINVAAAADAAAIERLAALLVAGGRLVAPLRTRQGQHLVLVRRPCAGGEDTWNVLEPVRFVPLISDAGAPARSGAQ